MSRGSSQPCLAGLLDVLWLGIHLWQNPGVEVGLTVGPLDVFEKVGGGSSLRDDVRSWVAGRGRRDEEE